MTSGYAPKRPLEVLEERRGGVDPLLSILVLIRKEFLFCEGGNFPGRFFLGGRRYPPINKVLGQTQESQTSEWTNAGVDTQPNLTYFKPYFRVFKCLIPAGGLFVYSCLNIT